MKALHVFTIINTPKSFFDGQFRYLAEKGHSIHVVSDSPEDLDFSRENDITYHQIPIARKISPFRDLSSIARLVALINKEKFDIVVGHTPKGAMVAMIAAKLAGVKSRIYYRHGLIYTTAIGAMRWLLKTVEQCTAALATNIINVSPSLSKLAVKDRLNSPEKQRVIGAGTCGGIDTENIFNPALINTAEKSALKSLLGIYEDDFIVGFCGRICKDKGIRELIDGFRLFKRHNAAAKLLLVGAFDTRDILPTDYKKEILGADDVISTGRIVKSQLPLYYSLMDVFVFPSYREGFGMSVIEASAMMVPVLVSRSHGCIDSIREHHTGEYIDISAEGVCYGLMKMTNTDIRKSVGLEGRRFVVENFDFKVMWPAVARFYQDIHHKIL